MGSVLCCVDEKKDYSIGKNDHFNYMNDNEDTVLRMQFKQPLDSHANIAAPKLTLH